MKTAVYPLNSCKDKGSPSLSVGLLSSPFFQLLPDVHVVEISLLRLKFTAASVFASPKNLLQDLPAWQQYLARGKEAKLAAAAKTWLSVLCSALGLMLWRVAEKEAGWDFRRCFLLLELMNVLGNPNPSRTRVG